MARTVSIETSYGFRSAQAAYDNATPFDGECNCEAEAFICDECGETSHTSKACPLPATDCAAGVMRAMTTEEVAEHFPSQRCPVHGWCGGCSSRYCEDCNG